MEEVFELLKHYMGHKCAQQLADQINKIYEVKQNEKTDLENNK